MTLRHFNQKRGSELGLDKQDNFCEPTNFKDDYLSMYLIQNQFMNKRMLISSLFAVCFLAAGAFAFDSQSVPSPSELKSLSIEELMNIEVTSVSKRPEKLSETPSAIQVITGEEIRRSGATSIPEALRLANNLHVAQKGSQSWGISARGFNTELANKLLVMIDGRNIYTPLYSGVFWERQDYLLEDIDRIEVISGPGGTLWGANAVNGIINIITKSAKETQNIYIEQGAGSELRGNIAGRFGGMLSPITHFRVYGKYFDRDNSIYADGSDAKDSWNTIQTGFRMDIESSSKNNFTIQGDFYDSDQRVLNGGTADVSGGNVLARWKHYISESSDLSLQMYFDRTDLTLPTSAFIVNSILLAPAGQFEDELNTYDVGFNYHFSPGGRHQIIWGLGYRFMQDVAANSPALGFLPEKLNQDIFSAFLQDEIRLSRILHFTIGSKVEHNDYTGWEFEPSARLSWNIAPDKMIWGAVSRAVRIPSRVDRDITQATPPYFVLLTGGADFASETVIANELGYRVQLGSKAAVSVSSHYNFYDNIRSTSLTPTLIFPLFFENNVEGESYGIEINANFEANDWWRLRGGYTLFKTDLRVKNGQSDFNETLNETADPKHQFSIRSSMDLSKRLELDSRIRWIDVVRTHDGPTPGTVPNYWEMDIRLGWDLAEQLELSITGQNLLHKRHPEYGYPGNSRVEIERSVFGKAAWRF